MLNPTNAIGPAINGRYPFLCAKCGGSIYYNRKECKTATGLCRVCCCQRSRLRPFESTYNKLKKHVLENTRHPFELSFADFLEFTQSPTCHYCGKNLVWNPWLGQPRSNLDRKDNAGGYTKENCVPCCRNCNTIKGAHFTYDEMMLLAPMLRQIQEDHSMKG